MLLIMVSSAYGQTTLQSIKRSTAIFLRGLSGPVYRTDAILKVIDVDTNEEFTISGGLVYRKLDEENGFLYISVLPSVTTENKVIKINFDENKTETSTRLYKVNTTDLKSYNIIWQQGLSWSSLILPIKYRPATNFNGTQFERTFSADLSVGPFLGYKFKMGKFYNQFFQLGAFAGPTLIQFPTTVDPNNGSTNQNNITNDNLIGFTFGFGGVFQFDKLQIGLIYGTDQLGGEKSKHWQYDNKNWWSFAVGYKFLGQ